MTTATTEPIPATLPRPKRVRIVDHPSDALLIPEVAGMPRPVRIAADKARRAFDTYQQERNAFGEAEQDAKEAPALDAAADQRALDAGEDLPEPTAPEKRKQLAQANRRMQAAEENARQAIYSQADVVREHYGQWRTEQDQRVAKREAAIREQVEKLRAEFVALETDRELLTQLERFDGQPTNWNFRLRDPARRQRRQEKVRSDMELVTSLRPNTPVDREPDALTAALLMLVGPEPEREPVTSDLKTRMEHPDFEA